MGIVYNTREFLEYPIFENKDNDEVVINYDSDNMIISFKSNNINYGDYLIKEKP